MTLRQADIGVTFTARDRATSDMLALGVAMRHAVESRLHLEAVWENMKGTFLLGEHYTGPTMRKVSVFVRDQLALRTMNIKMW